MEHFSRRSEATTVALPHSTKSYVVFTKGKNIFIAKAAKLIVEWGSAIVVVSILLPKSSKAKGKERERESKREEVTASKRERGNVPMSRRNLKPWRSYHSTKS